jgi:tRNA(Arg) A34 adenosine deaminase TadA
MTFEPSLPSFPAEVDLALLRVAIEVSRDAVEHGNHPFGAVLADDDGVVLLSAENTRVTDRDVTGHAETNLVRDVGRVLEPEVLEAATLYTSCEPCAMCAGAIYWAGIGRVVYALDGKGLIAIAGGRPEDELSLSCREVFAAGGRFVEVVGPLIPEEAAVVHEGFWRHPGGP